MTKADLMRMAWELYRADVFRGAFSRTAFADCLRAAWQCLKDRPRTDERTLRFHGLWARGITRAALVERLERALPAADSRANLYPKTGKTRHAYAAPYRFRDTVRAGALRLILETERAA